MRSKERKFEYNKAYFEGNLKVAEKGAKPSRDVCDQTKADAEKVDGALRVAMATLQKKHRALRAT